VGNVPTRSNLRSLTVTFEEDPLTLRLLMLDVECRRASRLSLPCSLKEVLLKEAFCYQNLGVSTLLDEIDFLRPTPFLRRSPLIVKNLYIPGTGLLNQS
jgi:hypothetical protein